MAIASRSRSNWVDVERARGLAVLVFLEEDSTLDYITSSVGLMQINRKEEHTRDRFAGNSSKQGRNGQEARDLHAGDERADSND
jgi:hypothetical protein